MKRLLVLTITMLAISLCGSAQIGLEINKLFGGKYSSDPTVTETIMSGDQRYLRSHHLSTFATFKGSAQKYEDIVLPLVKADGADATGRDVRYKNGKMSYAFFVLPPIEKDGRKLNRYLYYLLTSRAKKPSVMVIYFDGEISTNKAESLIRDLTNR